MCSTDPGPFEHRLCPRRSLANDGTSLSRGCGASRKSASKRHDGVSKLHQDHRRGSPCQLSLSESISPRPCLPFTGSTRLTRQPLVKPKVSRDQVMPLIARLPQCLIGMEACSGAYQWALLFQRFERRVKLMAPKLVAPYRMSGKRGKNDTADSAAPEWPGIRRSVA